MAGFIGPLKRQAKNVIERLGIYSRQGAATPEVQLMATA
jgi:hypothetical protein